MRMEMVIRKRRNSKDTAHDAAVYFHDWTESKATVTKKACLFLQDHDTLPGRTLGFLKRNTFLNISRVKGEKKRNGFVWALQVVASAWLLKIWLQQQGSEWSLLVSFPCSKRVSDVRRKSVNSLQDLHVNVSTHCNLFIFYLFVFIQCWETWDKS